MAIQVAAAFRSSQKAAHDFFNEIFSAVLNLRIAHNDENFCF
jgi:hypothetical protein